MLLLALRSLSVPRIASVRSILKPGTHYPYTRPLYRRVVASHGADIDREKFNATPPYSVGGRSIGVISERCSASCGEIPTSTPLSKVPLSVGNPVAWGIWANTRFHPSRHPKRHGDRFSHFCRVLVVNNGQNNIDSQTTLIRLSINCFFFQLGLRLPANNQVVNDTNNKLK